MKRCGVCGHRKPLIDFGKNRRSSDGHQSRCKSCHSRKNQEYTQKAREAQPEEEYRRGRAKMLKRQYGITLDDYDRMLADQGGVCAICLLPETRTMRSDSPQVRALAVDHDHVTGEIRGLLCFCCNTGIGKFGDSPDRLRAAAKYLSKERR